jgi:hypothetical protein
VGSSKNEELTPLRYVLRLLLVEALSAYVRGDEEGMAWVDRMVDELDQKAPRK